MFFKSLKKLCRTAVPVLLVVFFAAVSAASGETIRVRVLSKFSPSVVRIIPPGGPAREVRVLEDGFSVFASAKGPIRVEGAGFGSREFSGKLTVSTRGGKLFFLQEIPLETYVTSVVGAELPGDSPREALKTQAVLVRSYALKERGRHSAEGFDFCDLTHCQVFGGEERVHEGAGRATQATQGEILYFQGQAANVLFHSTCGGHTSPNQEVFGGKALPYLQGASDRNYCAASDHGAWETILPLSDLEKAIRKEPGLDFHGPLRGLEAAAREPDGRWFAIQLVGSNRVTLSLEKFLSLVGRELGWHRLKSAWFEIAIEGAEARFSGHGLGHGVGLCQAGAIGMAKEGRSYQKILRHYFPGTRVGQKK